MSPFRSQMKRNSFASASAMTLALPINHRRFERPYEGLAIIRPLEFGIRNSEFGIWNSLRILNSRFLLPRYIKVVGHRFSGAGGATGDPERVALHVRTIRSRPGSSRRGTTTWSPDRPAASRARDRSTAGRQPAAARETPRPSQRRSAFARRPAPNTRRDRTAHRRRGSPRRF